MQSLPQQSLPSSPLPAQDVDSEMVEILIWSHTHQQRHNSKQVKEPCASLLSVTLRSRLSGCLGMHSLHKSVNNNTQHHLQSTVFFFLYSIVWWSFSPPDPRTKCIGIIFYILLHYFVFVFTYFGYAIVILCICTNNTNVALEYRAIRWLAEQLLHVNTESEYCKTECHRAFFILGHIVCTAHINALFKSNGPTSVYLCPQAHVSLCESMSDPTGFGFVCVRVCSFPIRTEVHHSSRATAATTCLEWEVPHFARGGSQDVPVCSFHSVMVTPKSSFSFIDNKIAFFFSPVVARQTFSSWSKESVKKKNYTQMF